MKVLLDTNVIMDALQERSPFDVEAKEILLRAQRGEITCMFTANAATDIFYLYSKVHDTQTAKNALRFLFANYGIISVEQEDCVNALSLPIDDFEDALVAECAGKAGADFIITRDERFLRDKSQVKIITPKDFVQMLHNI